MVTWRPLRTIYIALLTIIAWGYFGPLAAVLVAFATIDVVAT